MSLFKRFAFWLPILAVIHYMYELIVNPIKDIVLAIDPLLGFLITLFDGVVYDDKLFKLLFPGFLLHFSLWLTYGLIIDRIVKKFRSAAEKEKLDY